MPQKTVERHNMSLYPEEWDVVRLAAKSAGQHTLSGGLRVIIADWARRTGHQATADGNGKESDERAYS
jgi:hypothetical protein